MPGDSEANQFGLLDSIGGDVISEELVVVFPMGGCAGLDRPCSLRDRFGVPKNSDQHAVVRGNRDAQSRDGPTVRQYFAEGQRSASGSAPAG